MEPVLNQINVETAVAALRISDTLDVPGAAGNGIAWIRDPAASRPVCHVTNSGMRIRLVLAPYFSRKPLFFTAHFSLKMGIHAVCTVTKKGNWSANPTFTVQLPNALPGVYDAQLMVDWAEDGSRPLGSGTGKIKFKVCLVVGVPNIPAGELSYGRLRHALYFVGLAQSADAHDIVTQAHALLPGYNPVADIPYPWDVAAEFDANAPGFPNLDADCQSMARYMGWLLDLIGFNPAVAVRSVVVVFACPIKPHVALESLLTGHEPHCVNPQVTLGDIYRATPTGAAVINFMPADAPYVRAQFRDNSPPNYVDAELLDGGNGQNYYEACFKLTVGIVTHYYPGGVPMAAHLARPTTRIQVLRVFARMAWNIGGGGFLTHYNYATQQLTTYTVGNGGAHTPVTGPRPMRDGGIVADVPAVRLRMAALGDFP